MTWIFKFSFVYYFVISFRVLILHLKRYGFDNFTEEQAKKQDKVKIERFINLSEYQHNIFLFGN